MVKPNKTMKVLKEPLSWKKNKFKGVTKNEIEQRTKVRLQSMTVSYERYYFETGRKNMIYMNIFVYITTF